MSDLGRYLTVRRRQNTRPDEEHEDLDDHLERKRLPFIESPVNEHIYEVLLEDGTPCLEKMRTRASRMSTISSTGGPILYKTHHDASTIELFYDLFFVANLATFTTMHEHTDGESVQTYVGFFTLLWFTWLNNALFDVRFSTDSLVDRLFKLAHFGVMTAFVFCGPIFDNSTSILDRRAFRFFAVVMAVSHALHIFQYTIVLIQSFRYKNSRLPLILTILVHVLATAGFAATTIWDGDIRGLHLGVWYGVKVASGVLTILISVFFRVISFKHSHVTERVSLLTLIVIGEGVLGLSKSASCIFKSQMSNNSEEVGSLIAAIFLLYLLWMLYFDQLDEEAKMGTIRQQFWALLHYPLHVAILLTVEGSTALIVWNSAVQGLDLVTSLRPTSEDTPASSFATNEAFVTYVDDSMKRIESQFTEYTLSKYYDWQVNLTSINAIAANTTFNSVEYNQQVSEIIDKMFDFADTFVFQAHSSTMGKMIESTGLGEAGTESHEALGQMYNNYDVVTLYFYVAAGAVCLILATMYWFGKPHRTKSEMGGPIVRIVVGFTLITGGCLAVLSDGSTSGYKFTASNWLIPAVALGYLLIIIIDTIFGAIHMAHSSGRVRVKTGPPRSKNRPHSNSGASTPYRVDFDMNTRYDDEMRNLSPATKAYSFLPDSHGLPTTTAGSSALRSPSPMPSPSLHPISAATARETTQAPGMNGAMQPAEAHTDHPRRFKSLRPPGYVALGASDDIDEGVSDDERGGPSQRSSMYGDGGFAAQPPERRVREFA